MPISRKLHWAGQRPLVPTAEYRELSRLLDAAGTSADGVIRAYSVTSPAPLRFGLTGTRGSATLSLFNRAVLSDGLESLECQVTADPRRGRLREVQVLLLLPAPDPGAPSRLQVSGPVRNLRTEPVTDRVYRVIAELSTPQSRPVELRFTLDVPLTTDGSRPVPLCPVQRT